MSTPTPSSMAPAASLAVPTPLDETGTFACWNVSQVVELRCRPRHPIGAASGSPRAPQSSSLRQTWVVDALRQHRETLATTLAAASVARCRE